MRKPQPDTSWRLPGLQGAPRPISPCGGFSAVGRSLPRPCRDHPQAMGVIDLRAGRQQQRIFVFGVALIRAMFAGVASARVAATQACQRLFEPSRSLAQG